MEAPDDYPGPPVVSVGQTAWFLSEASHLRTTTLRTEYDSSDGERLAPVRKGDRPMSTPKSQTVRETVIGCLALLAILVLIGGGCTVVWRWAMGSTPKEYKPFVEKYGADFRPQGKRWREVTEWQAANNEMTSTVEPGIVPFENPRVGLAAGDYRFFKRCYKELSQDVRAESAADARTLAFVSYGDNRVGTYKDGYTQKGEAWQGYATIVFVDAASGELLGVVRLDAPEPPEQTTENSVRTKVEDPEVIAAITNVAKRQ
jgi:hypothetical protein